MPGAEIQPAAGKLVYHGEFFGDAQRIVHGNDRHGGAQAHALGPLRRGGENHRWTRHHSAKIAEMVFGHPKRVEAQRFRRVELLEPMVVNVAAPAVQLRNISVKNVITELHALKSPCPSTINQPASPTRR
jgi:hypothetical protein